MIGKAETGFSFGDARANDALAKDGEASPVPRWKATIPGAKHPLDETSAGYDRGRPRLKSFFAGETSRWIM
jgi:hypothetical protein